MSKTKIAFGAFLCYYFYNNYMFAIEVAKAKSENKKLRASLTQIDPDATRLVDHAMLKENYKFKKDNVGDKLYYIGNNVLN